MMSAWNSELYGEKITSSSPEWEWDSDYQTWDFWGAIQDGQYTLVQAPEDSKKWFVPSKSEWAAFGEELGVTKGNYSSCGLQHAYWTSSHGYCAYFYVGDIQTKNVWYGFYIRLSATF